MTLAHAGLNPMTSDSRYIDLGHSGSRRTDLDHATVNPYDFCLTPYRLRSLRPHATLNSATSAHATLSPIEPAHAGLSPVHSDSRYAELDYLGLIPYWPRSLWLTLR
jgi:hypothetical protein